MNNVVKKPFSQKLTNHFKTENNSFLLTVACAVIYYEGWDTGIKKNNPVQKELHYHSRFEYHVVLHGQCSMEDERGVISVLKEGDFIIFPPNFKHRILYESQDFSKILIEYDLTPKNTSKGAMYKSFLHSLINNAEVYASSEGMKRIEKIIISNIENKYADYSCMIKLLTEAYIIAIARVVYKNGENSGHEFFDDKRVLAAVEYIHENCFYGITVSDVASHVFISTKQLQRIFEKELHKTPSQFLLEYKMSRVRELLDETDMSVSEIADSLGFSNVDTMIKGFKKYAGITPGKYRKWDT